MILCNYGCEQEGKHQFENGKWCCSNHWNKCSYKINNMGKLYKGRKHSKETITKMSEAKKGKNNRLYGKKRTKETIEKMCYSHRLTIEQINERYTFFSKIEDLRYNPDIPLKEKEIQVHCKYNECKNSKEKGGWFAPTYIQLSERIRTLEKPKGFGESNFYCSEKCKDLCILYNLVGDPLKNIEKSYTQAEINIWKQMILELDNYQCQYCDELATDVHHIKPVKTHPYLTLDPDNGISFCEKCHYKYGHKIGTECSTGNLAKRICI